MESGTMKRPLYETEDDLDREREIAKVVSKRWAVDFLKIPKVYKVDFCMFRKLQHVGWAEVKCRFFNLNTYPTFMLSALKWFTGKRLAAETETRFLLIIKYNDALVYTDETEATRRLGFGGRTDRNDPDDIGPVIYIPVAELKRVDIQ